MRPISQTRWRSDPDFTQFNIGRRNLVIHRDIAGQATSIIQKLESLSDNLQAGAGNRRSAYRVATEGTPDLFVRRFLRGGILASILQVAAIPGDIYLGLNPRPLRELALTVEALRRKIPVAQPRGAMVEWIGPALYRGFFITRALPGMTLWEFVQTDDDQTVRNHVLTQARATIETMHEQGLFHADLNLHNLLVTKSGESFAVIILDLDKSRLYDTPLSAAMRRSQATRLLRSARKLDPTGRYLGASALALLNSG